MKRKRQEEQLRFEKVREEAAAIRNANESAQHAARGIRLRSAAIASTNKAEAAALAKLPNSVNEVDLGQPQGWGHPRAPGQAESCARAVSGEVPTIVASLGGSVARDRRQAQQGGC